MGLLDKIKDVFKDEPTKEELIEIELDINSASYYQDAIEKLISKIMPINNRFILETFFENNMVVWKFNPCLVKNVKFEKDPKNEHDPNAIKIIAGSSMIDMVLIGYIPQDINEKFAWLIDNKKIYNINLTIIGGPKKIISKNNTVLDDNLYKVKLKVIVKK